MFLRRLFLQFCDNLVQAEKFEIVSREKHYSLGELFVAYLRQEKVPCS